MLIDEPSISNWCRQVLDPLGIAASFDECIDAIPQLDALSDLPPGTRVLVRCDTNVVFDAAGRLENKARLISLLETLQFGRERGWVQIVHGHIGVDGHESLRLVAGELGRLLGCDIHFLPDWMDNESGQVFDSVGEAVSRLAAGSVAMLENARRYSLELSLWRPRPKSLAPFIAQLTNYARTIREQLAVVHVNEGFAASNCDLSSVLVPFAMDRVAWGRHVARELSGPVRAAREAVAVIFSGAKFNKLDDLAAVIRRGQVRLFVLGGLLALPFLQAMAELAGRKFEIGRRDEVPAERIEQARRIMREMRKRGIELLLPVDFVLEDGSVSDRIPPGMAQRDVGPRTLALFAERLSSFVSERPGSVVFHNGVLGQFERPEFAVGTRCFLGCLHQLHMGGTRVYIGGGEGGTALARFGDPTRVTHCFTAGTTILKALGDDPIPYVRALYLASTRAAGQVTDEI
jgi:phosphoglycerate kinase